MKNNSRRPGRSSGLSNRMERLEEELARPRAAEPAARRTYTFEEARLLSPRQLLELHRELLRASGECERPDMRDLRDCRLTFLDGEVEG